MVAINRKIEKERKEKIKIINGRKEGRRKYSM